MANRTIIVILICFSGKIADLRRRKQGVFSQSHFIQKEVFYTK